MPVKFRVEFKIALLVFETLNGLAPQYLSELLVVKPIIIWPCLKRTGNKQIQEFDWLKSMLTAV